MGNKDIQTNTPGIRPDYTEEILSILRSGGSPKAIMRKLEDYHGSDIAGVLSQLSEGERIKLWRVCPAELLSDVFEYLESDEAGSYFGEMDLKKSAAVLSGLDTDTAVEILRCVDREKRRANDCCAQHGGENPTVPFLCQFH